ncbi:hypothetical protein [Arvimicrobium flavum]|uniref:hypothetical protein n=1 Tax=Arvimicrobium flavum TaxID=3393320 RepID=UPI00237A53A4|nr:hypothetical protein [Mesorhizobium shangrilense]
MKRRRSYPAKAPRPTDADGAAPIVRKFMIDLFDREDGRAADWGLLAETVFRVGFEMADEVAGSERATALMRVVHDHAYNRLVGNESEAGGASRGPAQSPPPGRSPATAPQLKP